MKRRVEPLLQAGPWYNNHFKSTHGAQCMNRGVSWGWTGWHCGTLPRSTDILLLDAAWIWFLRSPAPCDTALGNPADLLQ